MMRFSDCYCKKCDGGKFENGFNPSCILAQLQKICDEYFPDWKCYCDYPKPMVGSEPYLLSRSTTISLTNNQILQLTKNGFIIRGIDVLLLNYSFSDIYREFNYTGKYKITHEYDSKDCKLGFKTIISLEKYKNVI